MNKNTPGYLLIVGLLLTACLFSINLFFKEKTSHDRLDIAAFPHQIGGWSGKDLAVTEKEYRILETRNLLFREYSLPSGEKLFLFVIYSETNRSVFHPPEVCLIGSGITIVDKRTDRVGYGKAGFLTNKLYTEKEKSKEIVLYSYKAGTLYTENFYLQQIYLAIHQLFGRPVPGATIRVSIPIRGDERECLAILKDFLSATAETIDSLAK